MIEIDSYLNRWNLTLQAALGKTISSDLYSVRKNDELFFLKVLTPTGQKFEAIGAPALQCLNGQGVANVLEYDEGAMLLEFIDGPHLNNLVTSGQDDDASEIICTVLDEIHSYTGPIPKGIHNLERQFKSLFERSVHTTSDSIYFETANVARELVDSETSKVLLHGDIHHANILKSSKRGWLAIDPQPLFGERTYDVANAFFNPDNLPDFVETKARVKSMAKIFSERLEVSAKRVMKFAFAHGGLSSSWQLNDGKDPSRRLRVTKLIKEVLHEGN